jgi:hypothetical protein
MDYQVKLSDDGQFVWATFYQSVTMDLAQQVSQEAIQLARLHTASKFLHDVRGYENKDSVIKNYTYAYKTAAAIGYQNKDAIAILHDRDDHSHDFMETVARNAGFTLKLFTELDKAIQWLIR